MSDFFLDTELTDVDIKHIAQVCAVSPYSMSEIDRIMFTEVWPAFAQNLFSVAGEWAGWSPDFVQKRVLECFKPRYYFTWRFHPAKRFYCKRWVEVARYVRALRENQANHAA